jgi:hypothetical protein
MNDPLLRGFRGFVHDSGSWSRLTGSASTCMITARLGGSDLVIEHWKLER